MLPYHSLGASYSFQHKRCYNAGSDYKIYKYVNGNEILVDANVAVLIDYENVGLDAIQHLLDQLSDVGRVIIRRAYGDWSVQRGKQDQLLELGIEPIHQYHSNKSGKNSSDIRLAIEAIDLLYNSPIDTFVIVSSDSDFVPLVGKLRSSGKSVIVAGRREATSPTLIKSCDRYIFLDTEKQETAQTSQSRRRSARRNGNNSHQSFSAETDAKSLLLRAMNASMDEEGQVVGSKLYQTMRRIEPSFNFKDLKHRLFTQFLDTHTDVIDIIRPKDGSGDVVVQFSHKYQITPPPVRADNENRAARLVDPRDIEQETADQKNGDNKTKSSRPKSNRKQSESRTPPGRRLLGSTRPSANKSTASKPRKDIQEDEPEEVPAVEVEATPAVVNTSSQSSETSSPEISHEQPVQAEEPSKDEDEREAPPNNISWEVSVDTAWAKRDTARIAARSAASDAAKILGAPNLSSSQYPTLDKLLAASTLLQLNWRREGNAIFRK